MSDIPREAIVGSSLDGLKSHPGYKALVDEIIFPMYKDALEKLIEKDDAGARATINVLQDIVSKIDDTVNLGKMVAAEYNEKLKHHVGTP